MGWTLNGSVDEFLAAARPLLEARPAENTVLLTVSARVASAGANAFGGDPPLFGWWRADEQSPVTGAMLVTLPHPLRLSAMPTHAAAQLVGELPSWPVEVGGPPPCAQAFAAAWSTLTGGTAITRLEERLYRLGELVVPSVPGRPAIATSDHRDLLLAWVRIGPVYTPPQWRRHGYGSAVTAAASVDAVARGATEVLLFADVTNPTSNSIYQQLGFRPIADDVVLALQP